MGLLSKFGKDKQEGTGEDSGYYRAQDDKDLGEKARSKRASSAEGAPRRGRRDAPDPVLPEKKRARRRLVGAIALALAVAIGLPMLLDSEPKSSVSDIAISIPSKDKPGEPLSAAPAMPQEMPAVQEAAAPAPQAAAPAPAPASAPVAEARRVAPVAAAGASLDQGEEIVAMPAHPAEPAKPPKAAEPKVAKADTPKPEAKESKPEPKRPEAKADSKHAEPRPASTDDARALAILEGKAPEAAASKYVIQVGAFATADKVDEVQHKLKEAGIKSFVQKVSTASGERTRVRVGPFGSKDEAEKTRARLEKLGLAGSLIPV